MPIFEFKCLKCEEFIEMLVMNQDDEVELKCPKCLTCLKCLKRSKKFKATNVTQASIAPNWLLLFSYKLQ